MRLAIVFFASAAADLAALFLVDPSVRVLVLSLLGFLQTYLILHVTGERNPLDLFTMLLMLWAMQFDLPAFAFVMLKAAPKYGVSLSHIGDALVLANVSQLIVAVVLKLPIWSRAASKIPRLRVPDLARLTGPLWSLWVLSLLARIYSTFHGFQPGFEVESGNLEVSTNMVYILIGFVSLFPFPLFCALLRRKGNHYLVWATVVVLVEAGMQTLFAGTKAGPIITLINFAVAYHYTVRSVSTRTAWLMIIGCLIVVVPVYVLKAGVRNLVMANYDLSRERPELTVDDFLSLNANAYSNTLSGANPTNLEEACYSVVERLDVVTTLAATIEHYDSRNGYDTDMYLLLWLKPYVPRAIWPEKGWVSLGLFMSREVLRIPYYTHAPLTSTIEGYIAAGIIGAILLSFLHGAFVGIAHSYLTESRSDAGDSFHRGYFAAVYLIVLYFNCSYIFPREIILNLVMFWLLVKTVSRFNVRDIRFVQSRADTPMLRHWAR